MNEQARVPPLTAMAILIMPPGLRCDLQAVEKLTALTETKAPARCVSAGEAGLTSERSLACPQPRYLMSLSDLETGGFASPPYDRFALTVRGQSTAASIVHKCGASHLTESPRR